MHTPALIKAHTLIESGDIVAAESALATLADQEGDQALIEALDDFPAKDLLAVIREYDSSKESVLNLVVTPAQFARAVVLETKYQDLTHSHLRGMINSVIFRDDEDSVEFLQAIGETAGGCEALADYLSEYWSRVEAFVRVGSFDSYEDDGILLTESATRLALEQRPKVEHLDITDHDWMELTWLLRTECVEIFLEVLIILRSRYAAYKAEIEAAEYEDEETEVKAVPETEQERLERLSRAADNEEESAI